MLHVPGLGQRGLTALVAAAQLRADVASAHARDLLLHHRKSRRSGGALGLVSADA